MSSTVTLPVTRHVDIIDGTPVRASKYRPSGNRPGLDVEWESAPGTPVRLNFRRIGSPSSGTAESSWIRLLCTAERCAEKVKGVLEDKVKKVLKDSRGNDTRLPSSFLSGTEPSASWDYPFFKDATNTGHYQRVYHHVLDHMEQYKTDPDSASEVDENVVNQIKKICNEAKCPTKDGATASPLAANASSSTIAVSHDRAMKRQRGDASSDPRGRTMVEGFSRLHTHEVSHNLCPEMFYIHHLTPWEWIPDHPPGTLENDQNQIAYLKSEDVLDQRWKTTPPGAIWYWVPNRNSDEGGPDSIELKSRGRDDGYIDPKKAQEFWKEAKAAKSMAWRLSDTEPRQRRPLEVARMYVAAQRRSSWIELHCDFYIPEGTYQLEVHLSAPRKGRWESEWLIPKGRHALLNSMLGIHILYGQASLYEQWHPGHKGKPTDLWTVGLARSKVDYSRDGGVYAITQKDVENMKSDRYDSFHLIKPSEPLVVKEERFLQRVLIFWGTNEHNGGGKIYRAPFVFGGMRLHKVNPKL